MFVDIGQRCLLYTINCMSHTINGNYSVTDIRDDIDMSHDFKGFTRIKHYFYIESPFVKKKELVYTSA